MNYIEDTKSLADSYLIKCKVLEEVLQQIPIKKAQSTMKFLKQASSETLRVLGVKDKCAIMIWAKRFIEKHDMKKNVRDKA